MRKILLLLLLAPLIAGGQITRSAFVGARSGAVGEVAGPNFTSASIEDTGKLSIIMKFDRALLTSSVPKASYFYTGGVDGLNVVGEMQAVNAVKVPASLRYPINGTLAANFGNTGLTPPSISFINESHFSRIQQDGTMSRAVVYIPKVPVQLDSFRITVTTAAGSTRGSTRVTPNLRSQMHVGIDTFNFPGIQVKEGDRLGLIWHSVGQMDTLFLALDTLQARPADELFDYTGAYHYTVGFQSTYAITGFTHIRQVIPILAFVDAAPFFVTAGDSNFEGFFFYANIQNYPAEDLGGTVSYQLGKMLNVTSQNKGISGDHSDSTERYFNRGVLDLHPRWCIFDMTINSFGPATTRADSFVNSYRNLIRRSIYEVGATGVIVEGLIPHAQWIDGVQTDTPINQVHRICDSFAALGNKVFFVDVRQQLGDHNDSLHTWQIKAIYGTVNANHINQIGNTVRAKNFADIIRANTPVKVLSDSTVRLTLNKQINYTSTVTVGYNGGATPIKSSDGGVANPFSSQPVTNNLVPVPEDLYFDPVYQLAQTGPQTWDGVSGMAITKLPKDGGGYIVARAHPGAAMELYFTDQDGLPLYATDPNNPNRFHLAGFKYQPNGSLDVIRNRQLWTNATGLGIAEGDYVRLRRAVSGGVASFFIEKSTTGSVSGSWSNLFTIPTGDNLDTNTGELYVNAGSSLDMPQAFGLVASTLLPAIDTIKNLSATPITGGLNITFTPISGITSYLTGASPNGADVTAFYFYDGRFNKGTTSGINVTGLSNSTSYYINIIGRRPGYHTTIQTKSYPTTFTPN